MPRLVLSTKTPELQAMVKQRLAGVSMAQVPFVAMQMKRARIYCGINLSEPHDKVIIRVQPGKNGRREADVLRRVNATPATRSVKLLAQLELAGDDVALVLARAPHKFAARTMTGLKQFQDLCQVCRGSVPTTHTLRVRKHG